MNKNLLNQLPADEQPVASKLTSTADDMQLSLSFQGDLETQLMDIAKKKMQPGWNTKILTTLGWTVVATGAIFLLNWVIGSRPIPAPATTEPANTFEADLRQGRICAGPLALSHDFSVFLTNQDKTKFIKLGPDDGVNSFAWSADGKQLALVGGTGGGNIYLTDASGLTPEFLTNPGAGYLIDMTWSHDRKKLLVWPVGSNSTAYLVNVDGSGTSTEDVHNTVFSEMPQFAPDDKTLIFYNPRLPSYGLIETTLDGSHIRVISTLAEKNHSFAWSPDGLRLAYIELDRELGEARLMIEEVSTKSKVMIAKWSIPKGLGDFPTTANLRWSPDGEKLVFEAENQPTVPTIYLVHTNSTEPIKLVNSARAPTISADGRCLAYIRNNQVFVMDLNNSSATAVLVSDLPAGQPGRTTDVESDKLQWRP